MPEHVYDAEHGPVFDGEHCPRCGREVTTETGAKWRTIKRCPEGHFSHQSGYLGDAPLG
jgi:hypothetical protein